MKINDLSLNNNSNEISCIGTVVLPYHHGTTEEFQCIVHKTTNTSKSYHSNKGRDLFYFTQIVSTVMFYILGSILLKS